MKRFKKLHLVIILSISLLLLVGSGNYNNAFGSGVTDDKTAPVINSFSIRNANNVDAQGTITADVRLTEEGSGVCDISGMFQEVGAPESDSYPTIAFHYGGDSLFSGNHILTADVPSDVFGAGRYELVELYIADEDGNWSSYEGDELTQICSTTYITIVNEDPNFDRIAPQITSITVNNADAVNGQGSISLTIDLVEDGKGLGFLNFEVKDEEGNDRIIAYNGWDQVSEGTVSDYLRTGRHTITIPMNNRLKNGRYVIDKVYVCDVSGNSTEYKNGEGPLESTIAFNVVNSNADTDTTPPIINTISFRETSLVLPNVWSIDLDVTENESGIHGLSLDLQDHDGNTFELNLYNDKPWKTGTYELKMPVGPFISNGTYKVARIVVWDDSGETCYGDSEWVRDYPLEDIGADDVNLTVSSPFDIAYYSSAANTNGILNAVKTMGNGQTALLDSRNCSIVPKEVFEAIAGKDIILVFQDEDVQWVFDGKKIAKSRCKDVDLTTDFYLENGPELGFEDDRQILVVDFMDNGILPGETEVRINNAYISAKYTSGSNRLLLSYVDDGAVTVEDANVKIDKDEAAVLKITHNSRFVLSGGMLSIRKAKVSVSNCIYSGKWKKPSVTVRLQGKKLDPKYYSKKYSGNKSVGTAKVEVSGNSKFGYKGTAVGKFNINPKKPSISKVTVGKNKITVKMKSKPSLLGATTYKIEYRIAGKGKWKSTTTKRNTKTITKLKKGKKYQVRVRAYKGKRVGAVSAAKKSGKVK